jgi:hypothetical protein
VSTVESITMNWPYQTLPLPATLKGWHPWERLASPLRRWFYFVDAICLGLRLHWSAYETKPKAVGGFGRAVPSR